MSTSTELKEMISKRKAEEGVFLKVPASKLSMDDEFMKYRPGTGKTETFYREVKEIIRMGVNDFYRPKYDPSFNEDHTGIYYEPGKRPAIGKSDMWWAKTARTFNPECNSRMGTRFEYIAFLAVLVKRLLENGWSLDNAWNAVCNDSVKLGHYINSEDAKQECEETGSREICGFYDLANTYKILAEDEEALDFWLAGGGCNWLGDKLPLADIYPDSDYYKENPYGTGWLVLEKNPYVL